MSRKEFFRPAMLAATLFAFTLWAWRATMLKPITLSKITKTKAERIALAKMPGGRIRSAELETARGRHFWSVYIAKPGSKNAKEIRVDAVSGQILAVQTERPEDQAEEPAKSH